jgi:hypothetical protein
MTFLCADRGRPVQDSGPSTGAWAKATAPGEHDASEVAQGGPRKL